ncbi:WYL domain-containing protein [Azospirillum halopraeferens]|uniref:WYL domain-containing protein n=1 Tax=Azospirillum halopraeferens TaxID=34010 RepID=UPI00040A5B3D|nr:WYL domain-containing protein [Azospirillum halopraeferens]
MKVKDAKNLPAKYTSQNRERRERLQYIEFMLFWEEVINKSKMADFFDVSENTVAHDFKVYIEDIGGGMRFEKAVNRYVAEDEFRTKIIEPDAEDYLRFCISGEATPAMFTAAERANASGIEIKLVETLERKRIDPICLRAIMQAIRAGKEIDILYKSPHRDDADAVRIFPHALCHDGFRWACRCYRRDHERFGDLVLDRVVDVMAGMHDTTLKARDDAEWHEEFVVELEPNPDLDDEQRRHIAEQYGMRDGMLCVPMRRSMIVYFLKRYQIEEKSTRKAPHQEPLVVRNREEVTGALPPRMRVPPETAWEGAAAEGMVTTTA